MNVSDQQIQTVREFDLMDQDIADRLAVKEMAKNTRIAIHQILTYKNPQREDFIQLEEGIPGMMAVIAKAMGYSVSEFH